MHFRVHTNDKDYEWSEYECKQRQVKQNEMPVHLVGRFVSNRRA